MPGTADISPPFISVPGVPNFRDIGGYPIASSPGKLVRAGIVFRSSEPSKISDEGIAKLQALDIKDVYDLRSGLELIRDAQNGNGRQAKTWPGTSRTVASVFADHEYTPQAIAARFRMYATDSISTPIVLAHLREILIAAAAVDNPHRPYRTILQHLASTSTGTPTPILIHCSAGKDRTGVICALILSLCGVDDDIVAHEYSLSELGLKSRPEFLQNLLQEPVVKGNEAAAMEMVGSRKRFMTDLLRTIKEKWGTVDQCVIGLELIDQQGVEQLRRNLIVDAAVDAEIQAVDWQNHLQLVAKAEDEADKRIQVLVSAAQSQI